MVWFKIDDKFHGHPKARAAGTDALGLWCLAGSYCGAYLTDGFVAAEFIDALPRGRKLAAKLVAAGLWFEVEGGWQFHDWQSHNPTRAEVEEQRERTKKRQQEWRDRRRDEPERNAVTNASHNTSVTQSSRAPVSRTRPVPVPEEVLPTGLEPAKSPSVARASQRAQRLDPTWIPDPADHQRMKFTDEQATEQLASFRDYWCSRGRDAARLDWQATWRNWLRNTDRRRAGTNGHKPSTTDARVNQALELAEQFEALERKAITP